MTHPETPLRRLQHLATTPDTNLNALVNSVLRFCRVPMAALVLVKGQQLRIVCSIGLATQHAKRRGSFCNQTVLQNDLLYVPDALKDPRFATQEMVTQSPHVRFYAGMPIRFGARQMPLATLCVLDTNPGTLSKEQLQRLKTAALLVSAMLDPDHALLFQTGDLERTSDPLMLVSTPMATGNCSFKCNAAALETLGLSPQACAELHTLDDFFALFIPGGDIARLRHCVTEFRFGTAVVELAHARETVQVLKVKLIPLTQATQFFALLLRPLQSRSLDSYLHGLSLDDQRRMLSMTVDHFWEADAHMHITHLAGNQFSDLPYEAAQSAIGHTPWAFPFADLASANFDILRRAHAQLQSFKNFEYAIEVKEQRLWLSASGYPIFDADGHLLGYRGTNTDISRRKLTEQALRQQQQRQDQLQAEMRANQEHFEQTLLNQLEQQQTQMAHEIHDSLGSTLVGVSMMLKSMQQNALHPSQELHQVLQHLQHSIDQCRGLARGLAPVDDAQGACWRALERLCQDVETLSQVRCSFNKRGAVEAISQVAGNQVYRMAQEAMTNALRHGKASLIAVSLTARQQRYTLSINDNGIGLPNAAPSHTESGGIGMKSLQARCKRIGAKLSLGNGGLGGTLIKVSWSSDESK
jgi:signal transduction histidine kinase